jgi:hypothetical protein
LKTTTPPYIAYIDEVEEFRFSNFDTQLLPDQKLATGRLAAGGHGVCTGNLALGHVSVEFSENKARGIGGEYDAITG